MRIAVMVEGQEDVTWEQWLGLATTAEEAGLDALFRSDHYQSVSGRTERGALDAWATLAALAQATSRLRLGTLVSPATFRHPSVLCRNAVTVDHVSGGRVELGMGAGWYEQEHATNGIPFPGLRERYEVFEEQVEIVVRQMTEESFDFSGRHYTLEACEARPKPVQQPKVPLLIGGSAGPRSLRVAARWADEYNTLFPTLEQARERRAALDRASAEEGRDPMPLSVMTGCLLGRDAAEVRDRAAQLKERGGRPGELDEWLDRLRSGWIIGTVDEAASRLDDLRQVGIDRVMLQHLLHHDLAMVELMGEVAAAVA